MPGFDGTGPMGMGAMTGGGRGFCALPADNAAPGMFVGRGYGMGRGRGFRNRFFAAGMTGRMRAAFGYPGYMPAYPNAQEFSASEEKEMLKAEAEAVKAQLDNIQKRIDMIEKQRDEEK